MEPGKDKVGSAKAKIGKIIESPDTDPTKGKSPEKMKDRNDFMSDEELKPNAQPSGFSH